MSIRSLPLPTAAVSSSAPAFRAIGHEMPAVDASSDDG